MPVTPYAGSATVLGTKWILSHCTAMLAFHSFRQCLSVTGEYNAPTGRSVNGCLHTITSVGLHRITHPCYLRQITNSVHFGRGLYIT